MKFFESPETLNNLYLALKLLLQKLEVYVIIICKYEMHYLKYYAQPDNLLSSMGHLASEMLTYKITDPGLLARYT